MTIISDNVKSFEIGAFCQSVDNCLCEEDKQHSCKIILSDGREKRVNLTHVEISILCLKVEACAQVIFTDNGMTIDHFEYEPLFFFQVEPRKSEVEAAYVLGHNRKAQLGAWGHPTAEQILDSIFSDK